MPLGRSRLSPADTEKSPSQPRNRSHHDSDSGGGRGRWCLGFTSFPDVGSSSDACHTLRRKVVSREKVSILQTFFSRLDIEPLGDRLTAGQCGNVGKTKKHNNW